MAQRTTHPWRNIISRWLNLSKFWEVTAMHVPSCLLKNSFGIYHLRLAVPKKLRYLFGGREIKKSLLAGIYREALHKARKLAMFFLEIFEVFPLRTLNTMISGAIGTAKPGVVVGPPLE